MSCCLLNSTIEKRQLVELKESIMQNKYQDQDFGFLFAMLKKYAGNLTTFQIKQAFELGQLLSTTKQDERSSIEIVELIDDCFNIKRVGY
jgi:hypothetical protein